MCARREETEKEGREVEVGEAEAEAEAEAEGYTMQLLHGRGMGESWSSAAASGRDRHGALLTSQKLTWDAGWSSGSGTSLSKRATIQPGPAWAAVQNCGRVTALSTLHRHPSCDHIARSPEGETGKRSHAVACGVRCAACRSPEMTIRTATEPGEGVKGVNGPAMNQQ